MVILLSVFNGFNSLVEGMYTTFDPDILVTPATGKVFDAAQFDAKGVGTLPDVEALSHILEENVMTEYRGKQALAIFRGVDGMYEHVVPMHLLTTAGEYILHGEPEENSRPDIPGEPAAEPRTHEQSEQNYEQGAAGESEQHGAETERQEYAVVGQGLAVNLAVRIQLNTPISVYAPTRGQVSSMLPMSALSVGRVRPEGIFTLDAETDSKYAICSLEFMRELLDYEGRSSGVAIKLAEGVNPESAARKIQEVSGDEYRVQTRYEQKASMYNILKYEKWGIFCIILLVMIIASFSIIGSLVMLIIDKRPDIRTLIATGADIRFVRKIFVSEGMLISGLGIVAGMVVGVAVCLLQQHFGFVKLGGQTFLVDAYPVVMQPADIAVIAAATLAVNLIITNLTVSRMIPRSLLRL